MKTALIITLGNRDLQLKKDAEVSMEHKEWFTRNNDGEEYHIAKNLNKEKSFYDITRELFENHYEKYKPFFSFPMIQTTLDHLEADPRKYHIIFSTSAQEPPDQQDCYYIARIAEKYFSEKNYECSSRFFKCSPIDFGSLVNHYSELFTELPPGTILSVSGGTPDMRAATYFAGMFKGYQYLTIDAPRYNQKKGNVNTNSFKEQQYQVLKEIVEKMLKVYDYEGIRNLPVNDTVKKYCTEALELYNLSKGIDDKGNYETRAAQAIDLLIDNASICFIQGRYAETIGRLFRIEESVWYLLFHRFLKNKKLVSDSDKVSWQDSKCKTKEEKFERLLKNEETKRSFLVYHFSELFEERENGKLYFKKFQGVPFRSGKNFYYYFFRSQNLYKGICSFLEDINKNENGQPFTEGSIINSIRNKSYLGHGFQGVTKQDIEELCNDFDDFLKNLRAVLQEHVTIPQKRYFEDFNEKIRSSLKEQKMLKPD